MNIIRNYNSDTQGKDTYLDDHMAKFTSYSPKNVSEKTISLPYLFTTN
jgi:hypothetical protein